MFEVKDYFNIYFFLVQMNEYRSIMRYLKSIHLIALLLYFCILIEFI